MRVISLRGAPTSDAVDMKLVCTASFHGVYATGEVVLFRSVSKSCLTMPISFDEA